MCNVDHILSTYILEDDVGVFMQVMFSFHTPLLCSPSTRRSRADWIFVGKTLLKLGGGGGGPGRGSPQQVQGGGVQGGKGGRGAGQARGGGRGGGRGDGGAGVAGAQTSCFFLSFDLISDISHAFLVL
jgi:hypothetical protein